MPKEESYRTTSLGQTRLMVGLARKVTARDTTLRHGEGCEAFERADVTAIRTGNEPWGGATHLGNSVIGGRKGIAGRKQCSVILKKGVMEEGRSESGGKGISSKRVRDYLRKVRPSEKGPTLEKAGDKI